MKLTKEEVDAIFKRIRDCDKIFDGYYDPKTGAIRHDREFAYNMLRSATMELLEKASQ